MNRIQAFYDSCHDRIKQLDLLFIIHKLLAIHDL